METIVLQLSLTAINLVCAAWNHSEKRYKVAMLNTFAAGICFMGSLNAL